MSETIYTANGILDQIKESNYIVYYEPFTKKELFEQLMQEFNEFYKKCPYAVKWDYEKFIREMLDYYD